MVKVIDKDMGWKQIKINMKKLDGRRVKVGIMGDETNNGVAIVDYATWNEFGTARIPPRPFMAQTHQEHSERTIKFAGFLIGKVIDRALDVETALKNLGEFYQLRMRATIRNAKEWADANAPSTIAKKGSSSPLIDQGRMVNAVHYEVE
jgi:hypothetical protein